MVTAHIRPTRHTYQEMHPDGKLTSFGYDAAGQSTLRVDARGYRTSYVYDNGGRPTGRRYPDGSRVTQAYDAMGSRTLANDSLGRYTATYDSLYRTRTTTTPANKTITYAYDAASQRRYMLDPDGGRFTYAFDDVGRNSLVVNPQSERTTWTFDALGRTTVQRLANGCRASYAYDAGNRLLRLANLKSDGTTISSFRDAWDNAGNRTSRVEADGVRVTWSYDATYQLTREQRSGGNAYDIQYAYDNASNRRTKLENSITTTYAYDAANQLQTFKDNTGTTTFAFDNSGNQQIELTPAGARTTNTWDYENRLTKVQLPSAIVNTFAYNPNNLRVKTQDSTGTLKQVWDGQKLLLETDGADVTKATYSLSTGRYGNLVSQRRSGTTGFHVFDPLGSTDRLVNSSQEVTDSYIYQSFGNIVMASGNSTNPWRFVGLLGYYHATECNLAYLRARWLASRIGRFLSVDPLGHETASPFYGYVRNRPTTRHDSSGQAEDEDNSRPKSICEQAQIDTKDAREAEEKYIKDNNCFCEHDPGSVDAEGYITCKDGKPTVGVWTKEGREDLSPGIEDCYTTCEVEQCITCHEQQHITQINLMNPDICNGVRDGGHIRIAKDCIQVLECYAFQTSQRCLQLLQSFWKEKGDDGNKKCTYEGQEIKCSTFVFSLLTTKWKDIEKAFECKETHKIVVIGETKPKKGKM